EREAQLKKDIKAAAKDLDDQALAQYPQLTEAEVREMVIDHKWTANIQAATQTEVDAISQRLTSRCKELAERYAHTLTDLEEQVDELAMKVEGHLAKMGLQI
ncbi:MAG: type I restriction endonuclease subunit M, partial [Bacteroidota bacterium]